METQHKLSRRHFLQLTMFAGSMTLAACAAQNAPSAEGGAAPAPAGSTIRFITNDVGWREERYKRVLTDFAEEFPNIQVEYTHETGNMEGEMLPTWAAGGALPDVFYHRTQKTAARARLGWIKSLTPFIDQEPDRDQLLNDFWPIQVPQLKYRDEWYVIPENISSIAMKFRTEFFEEAGVAYPDQPWSYYEELPEVLRQLNKREGDRTTRWAFDPAWMLTSSGFAWLWLPAGIIDAENNKCIIDHPENIRALNLLQDLKFKEHLIPRTEDLPEGLDMFASDMVAMKPAGVWEITSTRDTLGEDKHWDVVNLPNNPLFPEQNLSINYGAGYAMGRDTKDPAAAWSLLHYLSRPEMQQAFIVEDNWALPGRKSVLPAWIEHVQQSGSGEPEHVQAWATALETGRSVPITPAQQELEDQYPNLIGPILVTGEARAEEVLAQIQTDIQTILDKYTEA